MESLKAQIDKIAQKFEFTEKFNLISTGIGDVNESDIKMAGRFKATIITMDIGLPQSLEGEANLEGVTVKSFKIIYDIEKEITSMIERFEGKTKAVTEKEKALETPVGKATKKSGLKILGSGVVRKLFPSKDKDKRKAVAGMMINSGNFNKKAKYRVVRENKVIAKDLSISSLKREKTDVSDVAKGLECGIMFLQAMELKAGDIIESYEL